MKQQKRSLTRKGRTLRMFVWLAVIVVLASALRLYDFLPIQTVRAIAETQDIEDPEVVSTFYDDTLPVTRFALHHLVDGKRAVMLCVTGYDPFMGWYDRSYACAETWSGAGLYGGLYAHTQGGQQTAYLFGKIEDEAVVSLSFEGKADRESEEADIWRCEIPEADIFEKNGTRYFASKVDASLPGEAAYLYDTILTGFDKQGKIVKTVEVQVRAWGSV